MRLIDADKLIRSIDKIQTLTGLGLQPVITIADVKELINAMPTVGGWISVKDKMPMLVETVLFTGKRYDGGWLGTKRGYFDGTEWYADDAGTIYATTTVTHWMPLPKPPEVSENS